MKKFVSALFIIVLVVSCHKKDNTIDGPSLDNVYGAFNIITPLEKNVDSVDFSINQTAYFTAQLSKIVNWKLTITGQSSGAVKEITGTSNTVDQSNSTWYGETTLFPVFATENCSVQLTFEGESDTLLTTIYIIQPKLNAGFLVSDFETGFNPGWSTFIQSGADMDFQIKTDAFAPQGNSYYNMAGTVDWDWLIGYVYFGASAYGQPQFQLSGNSENVYFNLLIYGEPGMTNTLLLFQFQEDENLNGTFSSGTEDMYSLEIPVNWAGWKLFSIKYSDIPCLVNGQPSTPNGNGQHNSDRIQQINMLDLANPVSGNAKTKVDYIIFTENGPLKP